MYSLTDLEPSELRPMTDEESVGLIALSLGAAIVDSAEMDAEDVRVPTFARVIVKRLEAAGSRDRVKNSAILWATSLSGTMACAVMWAFTLHRLTADGEVTLDSLAFGPFGDGVPTEEGYKRIWMSQKTTDSPNGNYLDTERAWK